MIKRKRNTNIAALALSIIIVFVVVLVIFFADSYSDKPAVNLFIFSVLIFVAAMLTILRKKDLLIYCFLLSFPFMRLSIFGVNLVLLMLYSTVLLIFYSKEIGMLIANKENIYKTPYLIIGFCFIYTTLLSVYPYYAFLRVLFYVFLVAIYFSLTSFMVTENRIKKIARVLMVVFLFCSLISFWQALFGTNSVKFFFDEYNPNTNMYGFIKRIPSVFVEVQGAAQYFAVMSIFSLGLLATFFHRSKILRIVLISGIIALILTVSRMAIIGFVLSLLLIYLLTLSLRRGVVFAFIISFLLLCSGQIYQHVIPFQIKERFSLHSQGESFSLRYKIWKESAPIIAHNPFGVGLGGYNAYEAGIKQNAYFPNVSINSRKYTHFENSYLDLLYALGIFGIFGFILMIIKYFDVGMKLYRKNPNSNQGKLSIYFIGMMSVWLISALTSPQFSEIHSMVIFFILLAFMNSFNNLYGRAVCKT